MGRSATKKEKKNRSYIGQESYWFIILYRTKRRTELLELLKAPMCWSVV
jgi:hypothetical protein